MGALPVEDAHESCLRHDQVPVAGVAVDDRAPRRFVRLVVLEPSQAVRERGLGLQQLTHELAQAGEGDGDRIVIRWADELLGRLRRVDAVQSRQCGTELAHDGLTVAGALRLPQHAAGDGLTVEPLTQEERAAEVLRVRAHSPDAWRRHSRVGRELSHRRFGTDVDQLDVRGRKRSRHQGLDAVVADRVEQQVAPARAGRALREVLDLHLTTTLVREPRGETLLRSHVSSLVHCS